MRRTSRARSSRRRNSYSNVYTKNANPAGIRAYLTLEDMVMRKLAAVLMVVVAFASYAEKSKAAKTKEKRFEAVLMTPGATAGSYRGPSESYGLVIEQASNGTLRGNYVEMGRVAVLNDI